MHADSKELTQIKLLIIEDDEDDFIIVRELLNNVPNKSFEITWASTYQESIDLLIKNNHDVCLLDYRLGAHDGMDILKIANELKITMPIIFLTGQGEYAVDLEVMKLGASEYLVKDSLTSLLLERAIRYSIERALTAKKLQLAHDDLEERVKTRTRELEEANEKLNKASDKIKSFAYSVSHDLKSPSSALIGLTKRFYNIYYDTIDEKGKIYIEQIRKASEQIYSLVGMINSFVAAKEMPLHLEEINLEEILDYIEERYSDQLYKRKIKLFTPDEFPVVRADKMCLIRILINLVENALKYGGDMLSNIKIEIYESSSEYILTVKDDGKGLGKSGHLDIFQPFERISSDNKIEGSGLGLAIVKEMTEKHGGEIWYDSGPKRGVAFHISISKFI